MRTRGATVIVIIALTSLAAVVGYLSHPTGSSEFGNMGSLRGHVLICHTPDRCAVVHPARGERLVVVLRRANPNSGASIRGTFGVAREGTFSGWLDPGTYRATVQPATFAGLRADTTLVRLTATHSTPLNITYRP